MHNRGWQLAGEGKNFAIMGQIREYTTEFEWPTWELILRFCHVSMNTPATENFLSIPMQPVEYVLLPDSHSALAIASALGNSFHKFCIDRYQTSQSLRVPVDSYSSNSFYHSR